MSILTNYIRSSVTASASCLLMLLLQSSAPASAATIPAGDDSESTKYVMTIDNSSMAVQNNKVVVSLEITAFQDVPSGQSVVLVPELSEPNTEQAKELPYIFINSRNQQIYFERDLKSEYPEAMAFRKHKGEDLHINYTKSVDYEPWMKNTVLKLKTLSCACNDAKVRDEEIVARLNNKVAPSTIRLYPVYVIPPADNSIKVREEKGSAYLCFVVDKWDIRPDYMSNPTELQKIHNSVNVVKNDSDVTIRKMTIEGYASPEGGYAHNIMLSDNRTKALKDYLLMTGVVRGVPLEASGKGENWPGFIDYLKKNDWIPQRNILLNIAQSQLGPDEKERQMRQMANEGYTYVLRNVFPQLRCTNYTVTYTVRPFTLEESERVFETRPINLNLNEIYRLADKYADNQEKYYSIIRKAYMMYPNDSYINLTLACLALRQHNADEAAEYLSKVNECPEKKLNEGIVAYLKGDITRAVSLVEQAAEGGVKQAALQLDELNKVNQK